MEAGTCAQAAHVGEDDGVGAAARHARAHGLAAEARVEHVGVHRLLPDVDPLRPALVAAQLRLREGVGQPHLMLMSPSGVHCSCNNGGALVASSLHLLSRKRRRTGTCAGCTVLSATSAGAPPATFMVLLGTRVRSAMRMLKRITRHMGPTRPFQVYLGMYSGMCVWYDTCPRRALNKVGFFGFWSMMVSSQLRLRDQRQSFFRIMA